MNEKFIEPKLTGISYSFTDDGWYEEAYYRAVSNRGFIIWWYNSLGSDAFAATTPSCPSIVLQWQHGKYTVNSTGSLLLTPIETDGRQQTSDPCSYDYSKYERYKQKETFQRYEILTDKFHNVQRLNLYQYNGAPLMPLYMGYNPPQMLPTMTLNPTSSGTGTAAASSSTSTSSAKKVKRESIEKRTLGKQYLHYGSAANPDWFWYAGLGFISLGLGMYCYSG